MKKTFALACFLLALTAGASDSYMKSDITLPDLKMEKSGLPFSLIDGYPDYKIVATHYRTDKKELRYILANPTAYNALKTGTLPLPEGSILVKIGWTVKPMTLYPDALEADAIQRVEYMLKDSKQFNHDGDHWGYARYVKKGDAYASWKGGTEGCISCHSIAKENDYLFTKFQKTFE